MLSLDDLSEQLGYSRSSANWIDLATGTSDPATAYLYRRAKEAGACYAYLFRTSPDDMPVLSERPALFLANARDADEAREIHHRIWLLGNAPFVIIVLPEQVRVYTGFDYASKTDDTEIGLVEDIKMKEASALGAVQEALKDFYAQEIDSGRIWERQAQHLIVDNRVDQRLLRNLQQLGDKLTKKFQLAIEVVHGLIGKYIYINYLVHRGIVTENWLNQQGLSIDQVTGRQASLKGLSALSDALEARFNGSVFPLPLSGPDAPDDDAVAYVAGVFAGDEAQGQIALEFAAYDFSFIPIELLSSIYEQFLRREEKVAKVGAYYTPELAADYLVSELNYNYPLRPGMRILDPCCGSGIFLVLVYRRLIEIAMRQSGAKLSPDALCQILLTSIYGVERNRAACYVTEFSLILTLLSYVEPPELEHHENFKFPTLHRERIFDEDFFDDASSFWTQELRFDWVIGNPPWVELPKEPQQGKDPDAPVRQWIKNSKSENRPVDRGRVADAFCWRVTDVLAQGGFVGLFIPAKSLTNLQCKSFRQAFFSQNRVRRITNFSNFAYVLFRSAEHPAATLVYTRNAEEQNGDSAEQNTIVHYGPLLVNQTANLSNRDTNKQIWSITINETEICFVSDADAKTGEAQVWKQALWANHRDLRILPRIKRLFPKTLADLCQIRKWKTALGLQLRADNSTEAITSVPELAELKLLDNQEMTRTKFRFTVPSSVLHDIPTNMYNVRKGRKDGLRVVSAPHLFFTINFAAYSDIDFVLSHPQIGISAPPEDADYLRAVAALFSSSLVRYLLFFQTNSWGMSVSSIGLNEALEIPMPELTQEQIEHLADLHRELSEKELVASTPSGTIGAMLFDEADEVHPVPEQVAGEFQKYLDDQVAHLFRLPDSIRFVVEDFNQTTLQFNKGKRPAFATAPPDDDALLAYAQTLTRSLDAFVASPVKKHKITISRQENAIACEIKFVSSQVEPLITKDIDKQDIARQDVWKAMQQQFSQWVYVQRSLRLIEGNRVLLLKPNRFLDWTRTQALLDADDIIGEMVFRQMEKK